MPLLVRVLLNQPTTETEDTEIAQRLARRGVEIMKLDKFKSNATTTTRGTTNEWTLWVVAVSCALHVLEEYFTGWQQWARETLSIVMPTTLFLFMNAVLVVAALFIARIGWRKPALSLVIPAATLVNAIFFHLLPTITQQRVSPGVYTAALLYVPFSSWAFVGAWRDGVNRRAMAGGFIAGTLMMLSVVLAARSLSSL